MQTFLPYEGFTMTAIALDRRRLCKQRPEVLQILRAITDANYGWQNHPAVTMWRSAPGALVDYGIAICEEWRRRGYSDSCLPQLWAWKRKLPDGTLPWWMGWEAFHESHRSQLIGKDAGWYGDLWPETPRGLEYVWPGREAHIVTEIK